MKPIRKPVIDFAEAMEAKLAKNDHKSDWQKETCLYLLDRLEQEFYELKQADSIDDIKDECTDVANFCMMLFHQVETLRDI